MSTCVSSVVVVAGSTACRSRIWRRRRPRRSARRATSHSGRQREHGRATRPHGLPRLRHPDGCSHPEDSTAPTRVHRSQHLDARRNEPCPHHPSLQSKAPAPTDQHPRSSLLVIRTVQPSVRAWRPAGHRQPASAYGRTRSAPAPQPSDSAVVPLRSLGTFNVCAAEYRSGRSFEFDDIERRAGISAPRLRTE